MESMKKLFGIIAFSLPVFVFAQTPVATVQQQVWSLTEVMYHDVVSPPAASRFYAYSVLTGYEIMSALDSRMPKLSSKIKDYPIISSINQPANVDKHLACLYGILETGKNIIPSGFFTRRETGGIDWSL